MAATASTATGSTHELDLACTVNGEPVRVRVDTRESLLRIRHGLAQQLGIDAANVEVISPYTGGGFGQKNSLQIHIGPLALAARRLGRPVKLVVSRTQLFHHTSFRPASRHRIRLGADEHGRMVAAIHDVEHQTSRHDLFPLMYTEITSRLYGIRDFRGRQTFARMDVLAGASA